MTMVVHACRMSRGFTGLVAAVVFSMCACQAVAGKVVLRIRAGNPVDTPQKVQIKANLPDRIGTNDIINLAGLELGYDVKSGTYYVWREVELGPKQIAIYDVELKDIWEIPGDELDLLVSRAGALAQMLEDVPEHHPTAKALQADVVKSVAAIRAYQDQNRIGPGVTPLQHIRAFETNRDVLTRAKKDVGRIENLVLASGRDPGGLVGEAMDTPPRRDARMAPEDYGTVVYRITVRNTSPTEARRITIDRELPPEITAADILDAGELEVRTDHKRSVTSVFKEKVQIGPNETLTYSVRIRDKWNVNRPRIDDLRSRVDGMAGQIGEKDQYASVNAELTTLLADLGRIKSEQGPAELSSEYVAFYRDQAVRLDAVERRIHRIEAALRPDEIRAKKGFRIQPPSLKTTWLIIYVILIFLGVMSFLFFLRWMTKSKAEKLE